MQLYQCEIAPTAIEYSCLMLQRSRTSNSFFGRSDLKQLAELTRDDHELRQLFWHSTLETANTVEVQREDVPPLKFEMKYYLNFPMEGKLQHTETVLDTGANLAVCSKAFAYPLRHLIEKERKRFPVTTGNGQIWCQEYIPIYVRRQKRATLRIRLYIMKDMPYEIMLGRTEMKALNFAVEQKDTDVFEHVARLEELQDNWLDDQFADRITYALPEDGMDSDSDGGDIAERIDWDQIKIDERIKKPIIKILKKHSGTIAMHEFDVGRIEGTDFPIKLIDEDMEPIALAEYHHPRATLDEGNRQIKELCDHGFMRPSTSPWCAPALAVGKKTGDIRLVFDWRRINKHIRFLPHKLPLPKDLIGQFRGKQYITTIDCKSGYWHIPIKPEDIPKTAFVWDRKLYEWTVMPMGLSNSPPYFQMVMDRIFQDLDFVKVYLDDISVVSRTPEEHVTHVRLVMKRLEKHNIKIRIDKCAFGVGEIDYLGYKVNSNGIFVTDKYRTKVLDCPVPTSKKGVQRFLGLVGYLHNFIPVIHEKQVHLNALTKNNVPFKWTAGCQREFDELKEEIQQHKFLRHPDFEKEFYIVTDASHVGIGGMLAQMDENGILRPIEFASKKFTETQQRWHVSEQELYAVIYFVEKWRNYLYSNHFTVYTDHKNLENLFNKAMNFRTGKLFRWAIRLAGLNFTAMYLPGAENVFADYLSRDECGFKDKIPNRIKQPYIFADYLARDVCGTQEFKRLPPKPEDDEKDKEEKKENQKKEYVGSDILSQYMILLSGETVNSKLYPTVPAELYNLECPEEITRVYSDGPPKYLEMDPLDRTISFFPTERRKRRRRNLRKALDKRLEEAASTISDMEPEQKEQPAPLRRSERIKKRKEEQKVEPLQPVPMDGFAIGGQKEFLEEQKDNDIAITDLANPLAFIQKDWKTKEERLERRRLIREAKAEKARDIVKKATAENKQKLEKMSRIPNKVSWNRALFSPDSSRILDLYDVRNLRWSKILALQTQDVVCYAIFHMLKFGNSRFVNHLPDNIVRYVLTGRFSRNEKGVLTFKYPTRALDKEDDYRRIVVPGALRKSVLEWGHSNMHHGWRKMRYRIIRHYWWPKMNKDIRDHARSCQMCFARKHGESYKGAAQLKLFSALSPFELISVDIVGPLPMTNSGNRYIVTIIDKFSRLCMLQPTENIRTETVIAALEHWYSIYGAPEAILSDNGSQFTSAIYKMWVTNQHSALKYTTAYHPQCNGQIERLHRWVKERLAMISNDLGLDFLNGDDWAVFLPMIAHAYNTTPNQMTSYAPAEIVFGRNIRLPIEQRFTKADCRSRNAKEFIDYMNVRRAIIIGDARGVQKKYDESRKKQFDKKVAKRPELRVGDYVFYDMAQKYVGNKRKFAQNYVGPFEITRIFNDGNNLSLVDCLDAAHKFNTHLTHVKRYVPESAAFMLNAPAITAYNSRICNAKRRYTFVDALKTHSMSKSGRMNWISRRDILHGKWNTLKAYRRQLFYFDTVKILPPVNGAKE